ncbi:uncharacterized protein VTP21DRAFT_10132 [Calcarisporiella thermophila]|uniref:uncharacterized protein n=1 Tax=Calcarisporiella thermophila TaxID=911321 RepID=UPI003743F609
MNPSKLFPLTPRRRLSRRVSMATSQALQLSPLSPSDQSEQPSPPSLVKLEQPIEEIVESFQALCENFESLKQVHDSLIGFNEAFGSFLFGIRMNEHCIEWPQAPVKESFQRAEMLKSRGMTNSN